VKTHYSDPLWGTFPYASKGVFCMNFTKCSPFNFKLKLWCFGFKILIFIKLILSIVFQKIKSINNVKERNHGTFLCTQCNRTCFIISNYPNISLVTFHLQVIICENVNLPHTYDQGRKKTHF
jgi:hypothetical protein